MTLRLVPGTLPRMHALVDESRANERLTDTELDVILIGSRVRNARRGVTGVLLKHDDRIVQYLEGDPAALARTFAASEASPLHRELAVLARAEHVERVFDRWHMGFFNLHSLASRDASTAAWQQQRPDRAQASPGSPLAVLLERGDDFEAAARPDPRSGA
jgi:hypothetical protein